MPSDPSSSSTPPKTLNFGGRLVGDGRPALIVGELSCNHAGSLEVAENTIRAMKEAGVDCVKLQTSRPDTITLDCRKPPFIVGGGTLWDGRSLFDLYQETYTPWEWHAGLKQLAESLGMLFLSSPFDLEAVDFLDDLGVCAFKIASFEITDHALIRRAAQKGKPLIISTGVADENDIAEAIAVARGVGNDQILVTKCVSAYPTPLHTVNLRAMVSLRTRFGVLVGLSDHSRTPLVPCAAVAMGACLVEKHFILDRNLGGPDAAFSLTPVEWREMVDAVRQTEEALGSEDLAPTPAALKGRFFARSLFVTQDVKSGDVLDETNVRSIRPGHGMHPRHLPTVLGRRAKVAIERGTPLDWALIAD
jgi:pseudaminic acid synthase